MDLREEIRKDMQLHSSLAALITVLIRKDILTADELEEAKIVCERLIMEQVEENLTLKSEGE